MAQILGASELIEDVHKRELCIGCGACVELCPYFKNFNNCVIGDVRAERA